MVLTVRCAQRMTPAIRCHHQGVEALDGRTEWVGGDEIELAGWSGAVQAERKAAFLIWRKSPDGAGDQRRKLGSEAPTVDTGRAQHRLGPGSWVGEMKRAGGGEKVSARASGDSERIRPGIPR